MSTTLNSIQLIWILLLLPPPPNFWRREMMLFQIADFKVHFDLYNGMNVTVPWKKFPSERFSLMELWFNQASSQTIILGLYILYIHILQRDVIKAW